MTGIQLVALYAEIWNKYKQTELNKPTESSSVPLLERGFVFQFDEEIVKPDVLFVGINPSYKHGSENEELFYTKEQALQHSYFKPFKTIEEELLKGDYKREITWTHMDMLVFRETQQSFVKDHLFRSQEGINFLVDQIAIAKMVLEHIQPKVLVVSNTMARELLGKNRGETTGGKEYGVWMGLEFDFDKSIGTDVIVNHESLNGTKAFFTSMLSGQRALDNGTKERLIWHINEVLKKA